MKVTKNGKANGKLKIERRKFPRINMKNGYGRLGNRVTTSKGEHGMDERVLDISETGCLLKTPQVYNLDEEILISVNGGYRVGVVVWHKDDKHGLQFKNPERMLLELRNKLKKQEKETVIELVKKGDHNRVLEFINNLLTTLAIAIM